MKTPVAFFIYNRPDLTSIVFNSIRAAKPPILLIVSDGPKDRKDKRKVDKCKKLIKKIDWACEVKTNYSEVNLGCGKRVSSGLDWVFSIVDKAIILEDDCLPNESFFKFCESMLNRFADDVTVMHIGGMNFSNTNREMNETYFFSKYPEIWGWATWRRAWGLYDFKLKDLSLLRNEKKWMQLHSNEMEREYWSNIMAIMAEEKIDTWDYQWTYSIWKNNGKAITPTKCFISNLGMRKDATHLKLFLPSLFKKGNDDISIIVDPTIKIPDVGLDLEIFYNRWYLPGIESHEIQSQMQSKVLYKVSSLLTRAVNKTRRMLGKRQ